ncbi:MAG TPA: hypothetical protein VHW02_10040 [Rhizomicrobium sp.]|jgi:hypothetical protein|nr:hypothetical protein [Rhizomicrobium sp.]
MTPTRGDRIRFACGAICFFGLFMGSQQTAGVYARGIAQPISENVAPVWILRASSPWVAKLYVAPSVADWYYLYLIAFSAGFVAWVIARKAFPTRRTVSSEPGERQPASSAWDRIVAALFCLSFCAFALKFATLLWIEAHGSLVADLASGRTYAVSNHGNIYIWPDVGRLYDATTPILFLLVIAAVFLPQRKLIKTNLLALIKEVRAKL